MRGKKVRLTGIVTRVIVKDKTETCLKYDVLIDGSDRKAAIRVNADKIKFKKWFLWR